MVLLLFILLFYLEAYCIFLVLYTAIKILKKKKVPFVIVFTNLFVIVFFFYARKNVFDHKWIFFDGYTYPATDWGEGLANVMYSFYNLGIVFIGFWITQVVFWIFFLKNYRKLNERREANFLFDPTEKN